MARTQLKTRYVSAREPRAKQAEALTWIKDRRYAALLMAMRCVDANTEYLSPTGWRKISSYTGGLAAEYHLDSTASFVEPLKFIKEPADEMWRFHTVGGVDQVLSVDHRMLVHSKRKSAKWGSVVREIPTGYLVETSPREILEVGPRFTNMGDAFSATKAHILTTFNLKVGTKLPLSNDQIRVMVAFHADGTIITKSKGGINLKKEIKKSRLRQLLTQAGIEWTEHRSAPGYTKFYFSPPLLTKQYGLDWWTASDDQRAIVCDEVWRWDGRKLIHRSGALAYSSKYEADADFIQYCFSSMGYRSSKTSLEHRRGGWNHRVGVVGDGRTGKLAMIPWPEKYEGGDGFMYSLSVPSTYLVLRRNGKVFVSGNTGKSKVVADDVGRMVVDDGAADLLVVAPGGVYRQWGDEIRKDWPPELASRTSFFTWDSALGGRPVYDLCLSSFLHQTGPRVLCVNTEALSSVRAARELCREFLSQRSGRTVLVIDESVVIGNKDSELTKFVVGYQRGGVWHAGLGELAAYRRILSGLPSPRSPLQLWTQFRFLDASVLPESYADFRARYCNIRHLCKLPQKLVERRFEFVFQLRALANASDDELRRRARVIWPDEDSTGLPRRFLEYTLSQAPKMMKRQDMVEAIFRAGRWIEAVPILDAEEPYRNLGELEARTAPCSFRVRLEDCYDMPESDYSLRDVELTSEQRRIYGDMLELMTAKLKEASTDEGETWVTASTVVAQMVRLHQVLCGHTRDDDGAEHTIPELRTAALIDLVRDYDGKFVVWCSYDADVRKVSDALAKGVGPVSRFWGGNVRTREAEERAFREDPKVRAMVGTPDAGGRGRDWSVADLVVYYSNRNDLDKRQQSEERVKAVGKMRPVAYVDLRTPGTVEDAIIYALRKKIDMVSLIQADGWRRWLI